MQNSLPLHLCHVQKSCAIMNRLHTLLHSIALTALIYYRASILIQSIKNRDTPILPWLLVFASELILSFIWLLNQAYRWRPVSRVVFPERLPEDKELPAIDVFICTVDPEKEPTVDVMNTVISAMALDYPVDKLYVYLSDDGGSSVTLQAMREAWRFAKWWLPFCRTYGIKTRCPKAYFSEEEDDHGDFRSSEFITDKTMVKEKYEVFKRRLMRIRENTSMVISRDHSPVVEVINDKPIGTVREDHAEMPVLVYVSREKRPSHPYHFKAGALNVLLRVSGLISNSPCILVLDCDMYCNDATSARQAMCFHLDSKISPSLAFVQFPQKFYNINATDIYDGQLRSLFKIQWQGFDGLEGPPVSGTGFYMKRMALYGSFTPKDVDIMKLKLSYGISNEFIKSLGRNYKPNVFNGGDLSSQLLKEIELIASCAYENQTKWGEKVGFLYLSVLEDYFTGFNLHCKGWTSVYCDPVRPAFLGTGATNLNDLLVQGTRWVSGLVEVAISRFCPLIYGPFRMSFLESMCYAELAFYPFYCLPIWCLATIPQLCLVNGIPLYPEVSNSFFAIFTFVFLSSHLKHFQEVLLTGGSIQTYIIEQRIWMIKSVTCHFYGTLDAIMKKTGMREASFLPTNKAVDDEQALRYQKGKLDFQASTMFLAPMISLLIINITSLVVGVVRVVTGNSSHDMIIQLFLPFFVITVNYPIIEGMLLRKDKGRILPSVTLLSSVFAIIFLSLGSWVLIY
ncbi:hypothetical protein F0562_035395 [Nyssa sinensis]|uniref:Glycosyltransferase 2-like domain-containing protein n=1 Tax=Nyssa sinensis TaxID=561372 RepID=A0A5J5AD97_9ASTE|nr:hypothetical protein F0562_035395 [Nyssa sinensis]